MVSNQESGSVIIAGRSIHIPPYFYKIVSCIIALCITDLSRKLRERIEVNSCVALAYSV